MPHVYHGFCRHGKGSHKSPSHNLRATGIAESEPIRCLGQVHDDRDTIQALSNELPAIDIHSL